MLFVIDILDFYYLLKGKVSLSLFFSFQVSHIFEDSAPSCM